MKIMMLAAGDSIHAVRWANAYASRGHEVFFLTLNDHRPRVDGFSDRVKVVFLPFSGTKGYVLNAANLRNEWKRIKPDVVNVHYASGYGLLARLARVKKMVLSVWGSDVYDFPKRNRITNRILYKNLVYADAIASTSNIMGQRVKSFIGDESLKITITPFGVDINKFSVTGDKEVFEGNYFWFGMVKKLIYKYGVDYVIKAFSIFYDMWKQNGESSPEPRLFICGKGDNKEDFEKLRDSLGLNDKIKIFGYIANKKIPGYMRGFDVFCLGSQLDSESFGVAAVEAMACGVPVIATDVDGFKEVIQDGEQGFIVNRKEPSAMAQKMWVLYKDANLRNRLGVSGRKRAVELYNWEDNVSVLEELLTDVVIRGYSKNE